MMTCRVCRSDNVKQAEKGILAGLSLRTIAAQTGTTKSGLIRHARNCVPALLKRMEAKANRQSQSLSDQLEELAATTEEILQNAKETGDGELALKAIDRRHKQVELHAKLAGEFKQDAPNPMTLEQKAELFNQLVGKAETKLLGEAQVIDSVQ